MSVLDKLRTSLSDRYRIERQIGVGGMATVYLARDLRHDRPVALKLLSPELGAVLGPERFLSEIRVTANLQHPNLLPLFDSGEAEGLLYYVMPYIEGESLRARLDREKQMPVGEAVRLAAAVAGALDYAHRHGVIHRDLKPENILLHDDQPLVADFGIALAVSKAGGERVTQSGLSLGTPQYMSPEQATGDRSVDGRTDIYSLGAVLYEMLTGEPPHTGATVQAIIARVVTDRPRSVRATRPSVPEYVDAAIQKALEKVPADRFETAREFSEVLKGNKPITLAIAGVTPTHGTGTPRRLFASPSAAWIIASVTSVVALLALYAMWQGKVRSTLGEDAPPIAFDVSTPPDEPFFPIDNALAISSDGRRIAYVGRRGSSFELYIRTLGELVPRAVDGTDGGRSPFFSPDGRWVGFGTQRRLQKISVSGPPAMAIADVLDNNTPAAWGPNNMILAPRSAITGRRSGLSQVSAAGGAFKSLTQSDSARGENHYAPLVLPDGKTFLFTSNGPGGDEDDMLGVGSLASGEYKIGEMIADKPLGYLQGHAIFTAADKIMAVPLDIRGRRFSGDPVVLMEGLGNPTLASLSANGSLAYVKGSLKSNLVWADQSGQPRNVIDSASRYRWPRLSPDGTQIAVTITASTSSDSDTWIYSINSGTLTRLTTGGGDRPEWSADGKRILYVVPDTKRAGLWWQPVDGSGPAEQLSPAVPSDAGSVNEAVAGPDGRTVLFRVNAVVGKRDIYYFSPGRDNAAKPWLATPFNETSPRFSPDGRWVSYVSDESGVNEVYVRPFPGGGGRVQVSTGSGMEPVWSRDGRRLYYRSGQQIIVAALGVSGGIRVLSRRAVLAWRASFDLHANYDVAPDGRLLLVKPAGDDAKITVIVNWATDVRARLAAESIKH